MTPGPPAICFGTVTHHRLVPVDHRFSYPVNLIWLDPDRPDAVCDHHPLWSASRPAPVRFRRSDYLDRSRQPLGPAVRQRLADALGDLPSGPLRMLTQPRTWGWLFNPITFYLAWDGGPDPVAALLEVTNTPWKERHLYPVPLHQHHSTQHRSRPHRSRRTPPGPTTATARRSPSSSTSPPSWVRTSTTASRSGPARPIPAGTGPGA